MFERTVEWESWNKFAAQVNKILVIPLRGGGCQENGDWTRKWRKIKEINRFLAESGAKIMNLTGFWLKKWNS